MAKRTYHKARLCTSGVYQYPIDSAPGSCMPPDKRKAFVSVYRPAPVLLAALKKFGDRPLLYLHPESGVANDQAGGWVEDGTSVDDAEGSGEIGICADLAFSSETIYDAYDRGERELSVGYTAEFQYAPGEHHGIPYDVLMTKIQDVDHVALCPAGRGGRVARVLDSFKEHKTMGLRSIIWRKIFKKRGTVCDSEGFKENVRRILEERGTLSEEDIRKIAEELKRDAMTIPNGDALQRAVDDLGNVAFIKGLDDEDAKSSLEAICELYDEATASEPVADAKEPAEPKPAEPKPAEPKADDKTDDKPDGKQAEPKPDDKAAEPKEPEPAKEPEPTEPKPAEPKQAGSKPDKEPEPAKDAEPDTAPDLDEQMEKTWLYVYGRLKEHFAEAGVDIDDFFKKVAQKKVVGDSADMDVPNSIFSCPSVSKHQEKLTVLGMDVDIE